MTEVFVFVLLTLGSYRIWRFLGRDDLTAPLREAAVRRVSWIDDLVPCPWCLGSWITLAVFAVASLVGDGYLSLRLPVLQAVAGAAIVGLLGELEAR